MSTKTKPESAAPGGDVEQRARKALSVAISSLAAIVNIRQTDEQADADVLPRSLVMDEVIKLRQQWDEISAITAALSAPKQVGETDTLGFDFYQHLHRQRDWSKRTFGPGPRTAGVVDHIRKELCEIEADPSDLSEWIDVVILALDGAWRAGGTPLQIIETLAAKQTKNEGRKWPDWRTADPDKAIEHDRSNDRG